MLKNRFQTAFTLTAISIVLLFAVGCEEGQSTEVDFEELEKALSKANPMGDAEEALMKQESLIAEAALESKRCELTSARARGLARANFLPSRPVSFKPDGPLSELTFREFDDREAKDRLREMAQRILGPEAAKAEMVDNGGTFGLRAKGGFAYVSRTSGAFAVGVDDDTARPTIVADAEEAINLALEQIDDLRLLEFVEDESLDVITVTSTHNANWEVSEDGETVPLLVSFDDGSEPRSNYVSDHKVVLGRRYKGVPIIGSKLVVRLNADGRLISFKRRWRDIEEQRGGPKGPVSILSDREALASRVLHDEANLELDGVRCGYVEAPASGYHQKVAGLGCEYSYFDESNRGNLAGGRAEMVNIAADASERPLNGRRLDFRSDAKKLDFGPDVD